MRLDPGTIAHWRDFAPGLDKFVYILGTNDAGEVLSFTISSQTKWLAVHPHRESMIEIPYRQTDFLNRQSYIQCFHWVTRTPIAEFRALEADGSINWRACMPQFLPAVADAVNASEMLDGYDQEEVLQILGCEAPTADRG